MPDRVTDLPDWAAAVADRLAFLARRERGAAKEVAAAVRALGPAIAARGGDTQALRLFLAACLDVLEDAVAARDDLAGLRPELAALCGLARVALATDCDDRPLNARARVALDMHGVAGFAAMVPGRVVWLAAMARSVPDEAGAAAVMLVNDLAAVDSGLPLRALGAVLHGP